MNIVINGGGGVGRTLAATLSDEQHDVTVIEANPIRAEAVEEAVDCHVVTGSGSLPAVLREAGAGQANIFIAVTDRDEVNLLSCQIARKLGAERCIARVRDNAFTAADPAIPFSELGIDQIFNPDEEASREIVRLLQYPSATEIIPLANGAVAAAGLTVAKGAPFEGRTLAELPSLHGSLCYRVTVIRRGGDSIIPRGEDRIQAGDEIFVIAEPKTLENISRMLHSEPNQGRLGSVMILGANELGKSVANMIQKQCRVKLVDSRQREARVASEELQRTLVIESEIEEMDLLEREGLAEADAFVAVADDEETNVVSCLYAKRLGVGRTVARVERESYRPLIVSVGVGAAVSARQAIVSAILKYIRPGDIKSVARMRGAPAEVLEFVPRRGARILKQRLDRIRFPRGTMVGMVLRPEGVVVPTGETQIQPGDHVIVFALRGAVRKVEKLF